MPALRLRSLLATTAVAAVLVYGLSGHGLTQMSSHEGMAGAAAGLCLLLVSLLRHVVTAKPEKRPTPVPMDAAPGAAMPAPPPPVDARARASPRVLQRFRN
jgi:hypothetical protein